MRPLGIILILILFYACSSERKKNMSVITAKDSQLVDTVIPTILTPDSSQEKQESVESIKTGPYSNSRFQDVIVERIDESYRVKGKAQVFEGVLSWVVEDGHNQLKKGFQMTDAGAPEFGNFEFRFNFNKEKNTTPHLILFESSAKDGTPQHELPIPLP